MKSVLLGLSLALGAGAALATTDAVAQTAKAAREQAEASMVLSGSIDIAADGSVEGFSLKDENKVDAGIVDFLKSTIAQWRFQPVVRDGRAVPARTPVSLRLVARVLPDKNTEVQLRSASFRTYDPDQTDDVRTVKMTPPSFPDDLLKARAAGDAMLLVQVDRNGDVMDAVAEQVNLHMVGPARVMQRMRDSIARTSVSAAHKWKFQAPTTGDAADAPYWTVRIPVSFTYQRPAERYGKWQPFVPGPRQTPSWRVEDGALESASEVLPEGGVFMVGVDKGPRLLTPLQG